MAEYVRRAPEEAAQLTLEAENDEPLKLDGSTAKLVWVDVRDANGTVVNTADNAITFSVDGPGIVVGDKTEADEGQATRPSPHWADRWAFGCAASAVRATSP